MSLQLLFIFPAFYSIFKAFAFVVGKKIPYICIVFKLLVNFCLAVFLVLEYLIICRNRLCIGFAVKIFVKFWSVNNKLPT